MLVLGHRGAKAYAPENTIPAFETAIKQGADGIELDVHLSKDNQMVVCHNFTVDQTSNGKGEIRSLTLKELKELDFGAYFGEQFRGTRIPTLREALETVRCMHTINIEIKSPETPYPGLPEAVAALVREMGLTSRVIVSSFHHRVAVQAKESLPALRAGLLYERRRITDPVRYAEKLGADALHPQDILVRAQDVEDCLSAGLEVNVWTVNSSFAAKRFAALGCTAVITNTPDVILRALGR